jgi:hypothetical protein
MENRMTHFVAIRDGTQDFELQLNHVDAPNGERRFSVAIGNRLENAIHSL